MKKQLITGLIGVVIVLIGVILLQLIIRGIGIYERKMEGYVELEATIEEVYVHDRYYDSCQCTRETYTYILLFEYEDQLIEHETEDDYSFSLSENTKIQIKYNPTTKKVILLRTTSNQILLYVISISAIVGGVALVGQTCYVYLKKNKKRVEEDVQE